MLVILVVHLIILVFLLIWISWWFHISSVDPFLVVSYGNILLLHNLVVHHHIILTLLWETLSHSLVKTIIIYRLALIVLILLGCVILIHVICLVLVITHWIYRVCHSIKLVWGLLSGLVIRHLLMWEYVTLSLHLVLKKLFILLNLVNLILLWYVHWQSKVLLTMLIIHLLLWMLLSLHVLMLLVVWMIGILLHLSLIHFWVIWHLLLIKVALNIL